MPGEQSRKNGRKGGRPNGALGQTTIDKALAREALRKIIVAHMDEMTQAQIRAAKGLNVAVVRRKDGTWRRIESAEAFDKAVENGELIEIQPLQPSTQAYTDLMNRALDKPSEHVELTGAGGEPIVLQWKE